MTTSHTLRVTVAPLHWIHKGRSWDFHMDSLDLFIRLFKQKNKVNIGPVSLQGSASDAVWWGQAGGRVGQWGHCAPGHDAETRPGSDLDQASLLDTHTLLQMCVYGCRYDGESERHADRLSWGSDCVPSVMWGRCSGLGYLVVRVRFMLYILHTQLFTSVIVGIA